MKKKKKKNTFGLSFNLELYNNMTDGNNNLSVMINCADKGKAVIKDTLKDLLTGMIVMVHLITEVSHSSNNLNSRSIFYFF